MSRVAVFIDSANLEYLCKQAGKKVEYNKLMDMIRELGSIVTVYVYLAVPSGDTNERRAAAARTQKFFDFLSSVGYRIRSKPMRSIHDDAGEKIRNKANFDVEIAVDMISLALGGRVDEMYLFSGDSDFDYLLRRIQDLPQGVKVNVVSPSRGTAIELKRAADQFIPLERHFAKFTSDLPTSSVSNTDGDVVENGGAGE